MIGKIYIGIDEVGRGALAGPLVLAAVAARVPKPRLFDAPGPLRDSKRLTSRQREAWYYYLKKHPAIQWRIARITPRVIDRINISQAAHCAALRLTHRLTPRQSSFFVSLDGGIILPNKIPHQTIIRGDEKIPLIALASIMAKVTRDRAMVRLHKKDPRYGFAVHKGYGTRAHRANMGRFGYSKYHRQSFIIHKT